MKNSKQKAGLYQALLKYWRNKCGMSQLDLSAATDVSARHLSFLETGRAQPSEQMVLLLAASLDIPLRIQNQMLRASGFSERFKEPTIEQGLDSEVSHTLERIFSQHDPFPIVVVNPCYDVLRMNCAMERLIKLFIKDLAALDSPANLYRIFFDPRLAREFVVNWEQTGRKLLSHLHLEALHRPEDTALQLLVEEILGYPNVPVEWLHDDFGSPSPSSYRLRFRNDQIEVAFLTTITTFNSPSNVTLEELRIESYFPLDSSTESICRRLAEEGE